MSTENSRNEGEIKKNIMIPSYEKFPQMKGSIIKNWMPKESPNISLRSGIRVNTKCQYVENVKVINGFQWMSLT